MSSKYSCLLRSSEQSPNLKILVKFLATVYGIWNLDFFRTIIPPICLDLNPLQALLLDYGVAFYPILLVIIFYILISLHSRDVKVIVWMWRPFQRVLSLAKKDWEIQGSIVNALATFLLLSFMKVLVVSLDLLVFTELYTLNGSSYTTTQALYYDGSVKLFSKEHIPYAITSLIVLLVVIAVPLLFLIFYPMAWFQKCLNSLHIQRESVVIFVDCFQGYYKDGTNGSRDFRYFSVSMYLLQIVHFSFFAASKSAYCYPVCAVAVVVLSALILFCQPYKEQFKVYSFLDSFMLLSVACLLIMISAVNVANTKAVYFRVFSYCLAGLFAFLPLVYFLLLCIWWIAIKKKVRGKLITVVRSCFNQNHDLEDQVSDFEREPDRLQNPMNYSAVADPLLFSQSVNSIEKSSIANYGTASHN